MANVKPERIDVQLLKGPGYFLKKVSGKVRGGIVEYKGMDTTEPIIWLGQSDYAVTNMQTKRTVLFYDTISKTLTRPSQLGGSIESDAMTNVTKNFITSVNAAQQSLGIADAANSAYKWIFGIVLVVALVGIIFIYLLATHGTVGAGGATTTIPVNVLAASKGIININP